MIKSALDATEHPTHRGKDEALSLTEQRVFGIDAVRCKETGRVYEQGSGALSHADQTALFKLQAEIARREAADIGMTASSSPPAVPARRRGAEPV